MLPCSTDLKGDWEKVKGMGAFAANVSYPWYFVVNSKYCPSRDSARS